MKFLSHSPSETEDFAFDFAKTLTCPAIVCLCGDLGAGKTAFTRGLCKYYGIETGVSSPTFIIMHRYEGKEVINHYDLYRVNDYDELVDIGFDEQLCEGINVIEWPDDFMDELPDDKIIIKISRTHQGDEQRLIEVID